MSDQNAQTRIADTTSTGTNDPGAREAEFVAHTIEEIPAADGAALLTNLPANTMVSGGTLYVTEVFSTHTALTPLDKFGITMPSTLYSIAYF